MASNIAIQKYYARLIKKGTYTMEQVPVEDREAVTKLLDETSEPPFDPVTQTPELKDEDQKEEAAEETE